jgi:hypothetical protein
LVLAAHKTRAGSVNLLELDQGRDAGLLPVSGTGTSSSLSDSSASVIRFSRVPQRR